MTYLQFASLYRLPCISSLWILNHNLFTLTNHVGAKGAAKTTNYLLASLYIYITLSEMLHCPWSYFVISNKQLWHLCQFWQTTSFGVSEPDLIFLLLFCRVSVVEIPSLHVLYWYVGQPLTLWINQTICTFANLVIVSLVAWRWGTKFMILSPPCWKNFNVPARLYRIPIRSPICVHMLWPSSRYFVILGYWKFVTFTLQFASCNCIRGGRRILATPVIPWLQPAMDLHPFRLWLTVDSCWVVNLAGC